jgi:hypothetical protein
MDDPAALKKPVILIVDDEPVPFAAMANALVRRYGEDHRITRTRVRARRSTISSA